MSDLLAEGLNLAMFGMGFVFLFLLMLVALTTSMSAILRRFASPATVVPKGYNGSGRRDRPEPGSGKNINQQPPAENTQLIAVITAAVSQHRSDQK